MKVQYCIKCDRITPLDSVIECCSSKKMLIDSTVRENFTELHTCRERIKELEIMNVNLTQWANSK